MGIEYSTVFLYIVGIIFLFFFGRMFVGPMKVVVKLAYSFLLGCITILIINLIGGVFDFYIALNPLTSFIVGILGIPGIFLTVALRYILNI